MTQWSDNFANSTQKKTGQEIAVYHNRCGRRTFVKMCDCDQCKSEREKATDA